MRGRSLVGLAMAAAAALPAGLAQAFVFDESTPLTPRPFRPATVARPGLHTPERGKNESQQAYRERRAESRWETRVMRCTGNKATNEALRRQRQDDF